MPPYPSIGSVPKWYNGSSDQFLDISFLVWNKKMNITHYKQSLDSKEYGLSLIVGDSFGLCTSHCGHSTNLGRVLLLLFHTIWGEIKRIIRIWSTDNRYRYCYFLNSGLIRLSGAKEISLSTDVKKLIMFCCTSCSGFGSWWTFPLIHF